MDKKRGSRAVNALGVARAEHLLNMALDALRSASSATLGGTNPAVVRTTTYGVGSSVSWSAWLSSPQCRGTSFMVI